MRLSGFELEVMQHLWRRGRATAPEVHAAIAADRDVSYSAVKTIFDRLERKEAVRRVSHVGRTIVYEPCVNDCARARLLRDFVARLFPGDRKPLFNALIRDGELSVEERAYLRRLLDEHRG